MTHQLGQRLAPIGAIVVTPVEIERPHRVVRGTNSEDPWCGFLRCAGNVADDRRLRRLQVLTESTAAIDPRGRQGMRARRLGRSRHEHDLLNPEIDKLVEDARQTGRPIAQAVRLASPVSVCRKRHQMGLGRDRNCQRRRYGVGQVITSQAGEIEHFRPSGVRCRRRRPANQVSPTRLPQHGENQIPMRVEIVDGEQELAEARLSEVLSQELRVTAGKLLGSWLCQVRGTANQIPHHDPHVAAGGV